MFLFDSLIFKIVDVSFNNLIVLFSSELIESNADFILGYFTPSTSATSPNVSLLGISSVISTKSELFV